MSATYKLKIPVLQAVQYTGENIKEIKDFVGDTSPGEELMVSTGKYTTPPPPVEPVEGEEPPPPAPPFVPEEIFEEWDISEGDWATKDAVTGKIEINPEGFPDKYEFFS